MIREIKKYFLAFCAVCLCLTACSSSLEQESSTVVYVRSFRYYLPVLEEHAREWAQDAYLIRADVKIQALGYLNKSWRITAEFLAPSREGTSITVTIWPDDKYETALFSHPGPLSADRPILEEDWSLDSIDAFDILFTEEERAIFLKAPDDYLICSTLVLRRHFAVDDEVTWMLTSSTCSVNSHHVFLDPLTGELLVPNW